MKIFNYLETFLLDFFFFVQNSITFLIPVIISVAFFTLAERKLMGAIQRRKGPNVVGHFGLLQPFADGLKAIQKEIIIPMRSNKFLFLGAPLYTLILSLISWAIIPFSEESEVVNWEFSFLFFLAISGLGIYGVLVSGWASNSKYALIGALRSVAQMLSYEISMTLILMPILFFSKSLNFKEIVLIQEKSWFLFQCLPLAIMFFIIILAETNRAPFDLPEAEAEIVAGYNIEYSGLFFAFFFLGEYSNMLLMAAFFTIFFLGGWQPIFFNTELFQSASFVLKILAICFLFILVRATFPRYRYDQLLEIGWKVLLPLALSFFFFYIIFFLSVYNIQHQGDLMSTGLYYAQDWFLFEYFVELAPVTTMKYVNAMHLYV